MKNIKRLISYIKPHRKKFWLDMLCAVLISAVDLIYPYISRTAMYEWLPDAKYKTFFIVIGILFASYIVRGLLYYVVTYYGHMFGICVEADMRTDLFKHVQKLSFSFFDANRTGVLLSRITADLFEIVELAHHGPENIIISVLTIGGALAVLFTISVKLALVLSILVPILAIFVYKIGKMDLNASIEVKKSLGRINAGIESALSGIRTGKAFANEKVEQDKFAYYTQDYKNARRGFYRYMGIFNGGTEFVYSIMPLTVLAFGGWLTLRGELNYVDLVTFMLYVNTFVSPLKRISNTAETFAHGFAGLARFSELMDTEPLITDPDSPKELNISSGKIEFKEVRFGYSEGEEILHGLDFTIDGGECVAVVGSSGGGKTTLCQLIPRFYDVNTGSIRIDGTDVRDVRQAELRSSIGIVQQDVFLFADTIINNIRYGRPDATDEEVFEAARRAEIYDDIIRMPDGFETFVGERGVLLSGGQKQRVAIARVFLKNPKILILDEATSALDSITEHNIQSAFDELAKGRTTIIIAHRLSTIKKAERILVVDEGRIQESGAHSELLKKNGIYTELYKTQISSL